MALRFKAKEVDNSVERLICTALIVSDKCMAQLFPILDLNIFTTKYTKIVANWCLKYYQEFEAAPKNHIQHIYEVAKRDELEDDVSDLVEALLASLSDQLTEDAQFNENYVLDQAEKYVKARKAVMLSEDVAALVSNGRVLEAEGLIAGYNIPKRPSAEGQDIFSDEFWAEEEEQGQVLFKLPSALHDIVGPIERDSFVSVIAPEKRGKTWWLMYLALAAFRQRCNVVFFSVGDMTRRQMRRRFRHMLTGRDPKRSRQTVRMPIPDCWHNQQGDCPLDEETDPILVGRKGKVRKLGNFEEFPDHEPCSKCMKDTKNRKHFMGRPWYEDVKVDDLAVDLQDARDKITKRAGSRRFRLFCHPGESINVAGIKAQLDILEQQEDFVADAVFIDYADVLGCEPGTERMQPRDQINKTWIALRRLAQERNNVVFTATQAKGEARKKSQVEQTDTSEDKRKLAHVTSMLALNQTPEEKRQQIMRVSNIAIRDDDFDVDANVAVLQCLAAGKPVVHCFPWVEDTSWQARRKPDNEDD